MKYIVKREKQTGKKKKLRSLAENLLGRPKFFVLPGKSLFCQKDKGFPPTLKYGDRNRPVGDRLKVGFTALHEPQFPQTMLHTAVLQCLL